MLLGTTCLALLILANGSPELVPIGTSSDKLNHVLAFAVLTPLAVWAFPLTSILMVFLGLSAFNATIEFTQGVLGQGRQPDTLDWLVGVAVSATILLPIALLRGRASRMN
jgi:hypothetical protein